MYFMSCGKYTNFFGRFKNCNLSFYFKENQWFNLRNCPASVQPFNFFFVLEHSVTHQR